MIFSRYLAAALTSFSAFQPAATFQTRDTNSSDLTGDSKCVNLMCISATVFPNSTTQYNLSSTGVQTLGWIAMGFGSSMADAQMVIVWPNTDGSVTLSQRTASGEVMPTVDASPTRVASLDSGLSSFASGNSQSSFVYTIPSVAATDAQALIWAFAASSPDSSAADAPIQRHLDSGAMTLNLTIPLAAGATSPASSSSSGSSGSSLSAAQKRKNQMIAAHGVLCTVGFLGFLPLGALLARWVRTASRRWFTWHWLVQTVLAGPAIVAGVVLGIAAVNKSGGMHLDDTHKQLGVALFALYVAQLSFGALIHSVKPRSAARRRPPQNYAHAIVGLLIIGLAFWQVRIGYAHEYAMWTGMGLPGVVNIVWIAWVVVIPLTYLAGLTLLRRQFGQEWLTTLDTYSGGSSARMIAHQEKRARRSG